MRIVPPSRVILVLTPAFLATEIDLVRLVIVGTAGAVLGDHIPYLAGRVLGMRLLGFYCRVTLASEACVETTLKYFRRLGRPPCSSVASRRACDCLPRRARGVRT